MGCCACFPIFHLAIGILLLTAPNGFNVQQHDQAAATVVGVIFTAVAATIILLGWAVAICVLLAGRFLARRVHYTYCLVVAGIACMFMPLGTVLGVLTIIVLMRPSVKSLFAEQAGGA